MHSTFPGEAFENGTKWKLNHANFSVTLRDFAILAGCGPVVQFINLKIDILKYFIIIYYQEQSP